MKYRTFKKISAVAVIIVGCGVVFSVCGMCNSKPAAVRHPYAYQSDPVVTPPPAPRQALPAYAPAPARAAAATTEEIRSQVGAWLDNNQDRFGQMKLVNFLPNAPFRATAIRFPDADAAKFTADPRNWSQIRIDRDRNGSDDERWLLKNGHLYKREVYGSDGKTIVQTEYFK